MDKNAFTTTNEIKNDYHFKCLDKSFNKNNSLLSFLLSKTVFEQNKVGFNEKIGFSQSSKLKR